MTTIIAGMTPAEFTTALNNNTLSADNITSSLLTGDLITAFHANYDHIKAIDSTLPVKTTLTIGMTGAAYIAALNQNNQKINTISPYIKIEHSIPSNRGSEYGMLLDFLYEPTVLKLSNDTDLIGCLSRGGVTFSRENFNIIKNGATFSTPNLVGFDATTEGTYDSHGKAAYIEKSGIIYCFHEKLVGVSETNSGGHNSPIYVKKSEDGGATWTYITSISNYMSYPKVFLLSGVFYIALRGDGAIANTLNKISIFKSDDNCATWSALTKPFITSYAVGAYFRAYFTNVSGAVEINLIINERNDTIATYFPWPTVFHIRSTDGITYYNTDRSWSKNVVSGGSITRAEAITNCLISDYSNGDDYTAVYCGGFIKNDKLYSLIGYGAASAGTVEGTGYTKTTFAGLKLYEGTTVLLDLSSLVNGVVQEGYGADTFIRLMRNGDTFDILFIDLLNNNDVKLLNYNLSGLVSTKLLRMGDADDQKILIGSQTADTITRDRLLIMGKVTGDMLDLVSSYSDLIVYEPNI